MRVQLPELRIGGRRQRPTLVRERWVAAQLLHRRGVYTRGETFATIPLFSLTLSFVLIISGLPASLTFAESLARKGCHQATSE